ncbi:MAG: endonuclease/exonuclease/phosphatase family protein [Candidatus Eremiobacteraeota bacterium]|nr:endonuclease/exonuclease/phosphatase family protein [Candidatus Eremiobacteraeota bacterium]
MTLSPGYRSDPLRQTTVKVATWNLWWRFGERFKERQNAILRVLKRLDPDLIALQEVWESEKACQAELLARSLDYHWCYAAASSIGGVGFGNAILSRWPITAWERHLLPSQPSRDGGRNCGYVTAEVEGPRGPLRLYTTHLSYKPEESDIRQLQVTHLARALAARPAQAMPAILAGDFNAVPESDEIRMLTGKRQVPVPGYAYYDAWEVVHPTDPGFTWERTNPYTHAALEPDRRLDYVFAGRPRPDGAGHAVAATRFGTEPIGEVYPSDHYGVLVELRY